jgi:hypothetical protein
MYVRRPAGIFVMQAALAGVLGACTNGIWNAGDLAEWVRDRAVDEGCERQSIELKEWYDRDARGNTWHGSCVSAKTRERMAFAIDVDPVWKPSSED